MKVGLALSGGGVLGISHLGVLEELERNNIKINAIAGTSAGAIIGLLYAYGGTEAIHEFIDKMEKAGMFTKTKLFVHNNNSNFETIELILRKIVQVEHFYDLDIHFYCTAVDIVHGELKVFERGDPVKAVMASSAYPGVFPAQNINGHFYIDGGVISNFPVNILKERKCDYIIGSSLYKTAKLDKVISGDKLKINQILIVARALDLISKTIADQEGKNCNFCFYPPVEEYRWYNFGKAREIEELSRDYARKEIDKLKDSLSVAKDQRGIFSKVNDFLNL